MSESYSPIHPKKNHSRLFNYYCLQKLCKYIYLHLITTIMFKKKGTSHSRKPHDQICFFYTDITFEHLQNHKRNRMKPIRDHHELFFCVKSSTDNPCIENEARRNNKISVYQTQWSSHRTFKLSPATSLTKYFSERCHSGCVNVGNLRASTSFAYILQ